MAKKFTKKPKVTTASTAQDKLNARLRERANRALRKRRRDKSHQ